MTGLRIQISQEPDCNDLPLPDYATEGAAGMDLYAAMDATLQPGEIAAVSTGVRIAVPNGYEAQIRPRSGLALKYGLSIPNAPGTIDSDYRGVVSVILINLGQRPLEISRGDRIAQMVIAPVCRIEWTAVRANELPPTNRGDGGFGHTGITGKELSPDELKNIIA